jgi:hypothetical protein
VLRNQIERSTHRLRVRLAPSKKPAQHLPENDPRRGRAAPDRHRSAAPV